MPCFSLEKRCSLPVFSLSLDFSLTYSFTGTAKGLSQLRRLLNSGLLRYTQKTIKQHRRPEIVPLSRDLGIPSLLKAAFAEIDIRSNNGQGTLRSPTEQEGTGLGLSSISKMRAGTVSEAEKASDERAFLAERSPDTPVRDKRCCEKQAPAPACAKGDEIYH